MSNRQPAPPAVRRVDAFARPSATDAPDGVELTPPSGTSWVVVAAMVAAATAAASAVWLDSAFAPVAATASAVTAAILVAMIVVRLAVPSWRARGLALAVLLAVQSIIGISGVAALAALAWGSLDTTP